MKSRRPVSAPVEHLGWPGVSTDFNALSGAGQDSLMGYLKQLGLAFVPTLVLTGQSSFREPKGDNSPAALIARARNDPRARYVASELWQLWQTLIETEAGSQRGQPNVAPDFSAELTILRRFHEAGIPVLPGTDFTAPFLFPGSSLLEELIELVRQIGMTPHEALQAATRRSAEMLHLEKEVGTVQVGKAADLVVLDADPLVDIANVRSIRAVVRDGRLLDRATLDELLNQAAARLSSPPSSPSR